MIGYISTIKPSKELMFKLQNKQHSYKSVNGFNYDYKKLFNEEFERSAKNFSNFFPDLYKENVLLELVFKKFSFMLDEIKHKEENIKKELYNIIEKILRDNIKVPNNVFFTHSINSPITTIGFKQKILFEPDSISNDYQRKTNFFKEVNKRIVLNGLMHGGSMHIWKTINYLVDEEINALDEDLMVLYEAFSTFVSYMQFVLYYKSPQILFGTTNYEINKTAKKFDVHSYCEGINFICLCNEAIKNVFAMSIDSGIPDWMTKEELKYFYFITENYSDEIWHFSIGNSLYNKLIEKNDLDISEVPQKLFELSNLSLQEIQEQINL